MNTRECVANFCVEADADFYEIDFGKIGRNLEEILKCFAEQNAGGRY